MMLYQGINLQKIQKLALIHALVLELIQFLNWPLYTFSVPFIPTCVFVMQALTMQVLVLIPTHTHSEAFREKSLLINYYNRSSFNVLIAYSVLSHSSR